MAYFRTPRADRRAAGAAEDAGDGSLGRAARLRRTIRRSRRCWAGWDGRGLSGDDRQIGEAVAIKVLRPELGTLDPTLLERFKQELRLARRITHRNVVRTYDLGEADGTYYITMELVAGHDARTRSSGRRGGSTCRRDAHDRQAALPGARGGARGGDRAPGHQAAEPDRRPGRISQGDGFRDCPAGGASAGGGRALTAVGWWWGRPSTWHRSSSSASRWTREPISLRPGPCCSSASPDSWRSTVRVWPSWEPNTCAGHRATRRSLNPEVSPELSRIILRALAREPRDRWPSAAALLHALEAV